MANYAGFKPSINTTDYLDKIPDLMDQLTLDVTATEYDTNIIVRTQLASTGSISITLLSTAFETYVYNIATTGIITFTFNYNATPTATTPGSSTAPAQEFTLELFGGGTNNPVWPASVKWPGGTEPTWTVGVDIIKFITRDSGTTWYGSVVGLGFA